MGYNSANALPLQENDGETPPNTVYDNVLDDPDPSICFVKAYARKPLGKPMRKGQQSNSMDNWFDAYDDDEYEEEEDGLYDYYENDYGYDDYYDDDNYAD